MRPGDLVFLDAQVLCQLSYPDGGEKGRLVRAWARRLIEAGVRCFVPEVSLYEVRRELIRARKTAGVRQLESLRSALDYAPVTTPAWDLAGALWAESRARGRPTGPDLSIDADVLLAATALTAAGTNRGVVVASANVKHLAQFVPTRPWDQIEPEESPAVLGFPGVAVAG